VHGVGVGVRQVTVSEAVFEAPLPPLLLKLAMLL
jgi:hypothetical protein